MARSEHIAVVGAGLMGHGIAQVFASRGHEVALTDTDGKVLACSLDRIRSNLRFMVENGIGTDDDIESAIENIRLKSDLKETVSGARFVIEAIPEKLDLKQQLFREIEAFCSPTTVFATNTSVMSITEVGTKVKRRERVVGTHFWNPPYLIPLVEVTGGKHTSAEVVDYAIDLLRTAGKHPVRVNKDVPGFVGNRLQHALWREAISLVDQGIADAATVDEVIKNSFGIRLPVLAPLETADMVGLDLTLQIHDYILRHLDRSTRPASVLRHKVEKGELGFKEGKGFHVWSRENAEEREKQLLEHLIRWVKEHGSE
jgi:3-hydroxybutyryl-CoA dehydrogenase